MHHGNLLCDILSYTVIIQYIIVLCIHVIYKLLLIIIHKNNHQQNNVTIKVPYYKGCTHNNNIFLLYIAIRIITETHNKALKNRAWTCHTV